MYHQRPARVYHVGRTRRPHLLLVLASKLVVITDIARLKIFVVATDLRHMQLLARVKVTEAWVGAYPLLQLTPTVPQQCL